MTNDELSFKHYLIGFALGVLASHPLTATLANDLFNLFTQVK
ncbi:hypothetical protein AB4539_00650 [Vibrio splendidus]